MSEPISYLKEAFKRQENLIGLVGFCVAGLFFNTGFLLLGGMLEILYLWKIAGHPRFQRIVRAEKNRSQLGFDEGKRIRLMSLLPPNEKNRYHSLEETCKKVYEAWESFDDVTKSILQNSIDKLAYLLDTFLRTQITLSSINNYLLHSDKGQIDKELKSLEQEVGNKQMSEKLREVKTKNVEILRQRSLKLNKLQENVEVMKAQLNTLENAIKFVGDQSVSITDPKQISAQIESVVTEAQDAENSIKDVEIFLEAQDDLDKKELGEQQIAQKQK